MLAAHARELFALTLLPIGACLVPDPWKIIAILFACQAAIIVVSILLTDVSNARTVQREMTRTRELIESQTVAPVPVRSARGAS